MCLVLKWPVFSCGPLYSILRLFIIQSNLKPRIKDYRHYIQKSFHVNSPMHTTFHIHCFNLAKMPIFQYLQNFNCYNSGRERDKRVLNFSPYLEVLITHIKCSYCCRFRKIYFIQILSF